MLLCRDIQSSINMHLSEVSIKDSIKNTSTLSIISDQNVRGIWNKIKINKSNVGYRLNN